MERPQVTTLTDRLNKFLVTIGAIAPEKLKAGPAMARQTKADVVLEQLTELRSELRETKALLEHLSAQVSATHWRYVSVGAPIGTRMSTMEFANPSSPTALALGWNDAEWKDIPSSGTGLIEPTSEDVWTGMWKFLQPGIPSVGQEPNPSKTAGVQKSS